MVEARRLREHALGRVDGDQARLVAVGVGVHAQAGAVVGLEVGFVLRRRHHPDAVRRAVEVPGPAQPRREALDRAVEDHLDEPVAQPLGAARHERAHVLDAGRGRVGAVRRLERGRDAHAAVVAPGRCFERGAIGAAEPVDEVGRGRHADARSETGEQGHAAFGHRRERARRADLAVDEEHRRRLLQLAGRLAGARHGGRRRIGDVLRVAHDALDLVVAGDVGEAQHRRVDVHQVAVGVADDDRPGGADAVEVDRSSSARRRSRPDRIPRRSARRRRRGRRRASPDRPRPAGRRRPPSSAGRASACRRDRRGRTSRGTAAATCCPPSSGSGPRPGPASAPRRRTARRGRTGPTRRRARGRRRRGCGRRARRRGSPSAARGSS